MGRHSKLTPAVLQTITDRLSKGEPLAVICRDEGMPHDSTVRDWMARDEAVSLAIARARDSGEDYLAAECLLIADTPVEGVIEKMELQVQRDGTSRMVVVERRREDMLGHRKLQIETRLKLLAKWNPRKWGDGVTVRGDKNNPVQTETRTRYDLTDAELLAIASKAKDDGAG